VIAGIVAVLLVVFGNELAPAPVLGASGYQVDLIRPLAPGVEYRRLVRNEGPVVAHVVRVQPNPSSPLRAVLSNDRVVDRELTSEMCRRVSCIAAVNGDFFHSTGEPVGAVAHAGGLLRSPEEGHDQLAVSGAGGLSAGRVSWSGRLVSSDLGSLNLDGVNRPPVDGVILFTPDYGPSTPLSSSGAQIVLRILELPHPLGSGQTGVVELISLSESAGGTEIRAGEAILFGQGSGADSLRDLWKRSKANLLGQRALFRLETSPSMLESVGGSPLLLREGQVAVNGDAPDPTGLITKAHPRTMVGWNGSESFLVVVDGRQPGYSMGLTIPDAANLLIHLGATEGINLDGGGSTTLAVGGTVVNRPSDRLVVRDGKEQVVTEPRPNDTVIGYVERPVADALAVVATSPLSILGDLLGTNLVNPPPGVAPARPEDDPASRP
jgi:hypothetical protein